MRNFKCVNKRIFAFFPPKDCAPRRHFDSAPARRGNVVAVSLKLNRQVRKQSGGMSPLWTISKTNSMLANWCCGIGTSASFRRWKLNTDPTVASMSWWEARAAANARNRFVREALRHPSHNATIDSRRAMRAMRGTLIAESRNIATHSKSTLEFVQLRIGSRILIS